MHKIKRRTLLFTLLMLLLNGCVHPEQALPVSTSVTSSVLSPTPVPPQPTSMPVPTATETPPTLISPTQALTSWPIYTLQDVGLTVRYPPGWAVRESPNRSLQSLAMHSVGFIPPRYAKSDAPQVPHISLAVYRPPLTDTLRAWLDAHSTADPFGSPADPEVHFFGVNDIMEVEVSGFPALRFTHDVFGFTVHELLLAMGETVVSLGYCDLSIENLETAFLQMQESLAPTTPTQPPESKFPRTNAWFNAYGSEYPSDEQMQQLVDAFSADVIAYLQKTIDPTLPLESQSPSLTQMAADLPLFEGGQVIPVELGSGAAAELFVLPNFRAIGGPMLYVRYTDAGWQTFPVPVVPPGGGKAVANAPNLWPASAEVRDVTGDGQVEAIVRHTFAGGSSWREHPQVLRWNGAGFDVLFRAELVNWAGPSEWRFVPHGSAQDIVITYPVFMPSRPQKFDPHPEGVQRWRYDPAADRYVLWGTAVQTPLPWVGDLATAEAALQTSDYRTALTAYESFLSDETWQEDFLHDYRTDVGGERDVGQRELAAWLDLARLHAGLCHAALDEPTAARQVLSAIESALQADLAAAFLMAYGENADLVAALTAYERAIAAAAQADEQPQTGGGVWSLYPQPYSELILLNRDPALLKAAVQDHGLPVEGLWADLDDDGRDEFAWLDVGEWRVVWVAWQDADGRWQAIGLEAEDDLTLTSVRTAEIVIQYRGEERVLQWDGELKMVQVPPDRRISDWPIVGILAPSTTQ
jgi:hypothetical protein